MKRLIKIPFSLFILILFSNTGCLVFNNISYEMVLNEDRSGTATLNIFDITSDATNDEAFNQDTSGLFSFMLKSDEFMEEMKKEGRYITNRTLILDGDNLNAEVKFDFANIVGVENIAHEDGFYYLTLELADSIISTNGEIIQSKAYKRILWDDKQKVLKFAMFSAETDVYRKLSTYYKKQE